MTDGAANDPRTILAAVLVTVDPAEKAAAAKAVRSDSFSAVPDTAPSDWPLPARRDRPELKPPSEMPKRGLGSEAGRCALLHAIAHIELNAIDLAADMAGRFAHLVPRERRTEFVIDWLSVMADEARHFGLVATRLEVLGAPYGSLPAHDGLFDAAARTAHDWKARLAIAPLVLEARGLDVTPGMIDRLRRAGDPQSADILDIIYTDEIGHVAAGTKWFRFACAAEGKDPAPAFRHLVETYFPGGLKKPFNHTARATAGLAEYWYEPLAR